MQRRILLKGTLATGLLGLITGSALLTPVRVIGAWNEKAFSASDMKLAAMALGDKGEAIESDKIELSVKDIAENASVVPLKITTKLDNVESIRVYVEKNPFPLIATFTPTAYSGNFYAIRTRMKETSKVIAVAKANGQLHMTSKTIKVTVGGCA
jgi:sulfur-oxidizing protein SoxY